MAFNIHWKIPFKALRSGTLYTVNIYKDGTLPSGYPLTLKGGAEPFTTQEDNNEDMFTPIRTQTGYLRIVDDGQALNASNATVSFNWKELLPQSNNDRPVTLTDSNNNVMWQGFMQAQNFSGTLYGNPQEREFPVHCVLSALNGVDIPTTVPTGMQMILDFAHLLSFIFSNVATESGSVLQNGYFMFQGASRGQVILGAKIDWSNFLTTDEDGNTSARYTLYQVLKDFCKFWGYTVRVYQKDVFFTLADDSSASACLKITEAELPTVPQMEDQEIVAHSETMFSSVYIASGFVTTDNEDMTVLGPGKAEVKADTNAQKQLVEFAPTEVEKTMENGGYTWVAGDRDLVGYFTTPAISSFTCPILTGTGKFCRRQIYSTQDQANGTDVDEIMIQGYGSPDSSAKAMLQTKVPRAYGGGTIRMRGEFYGGWEPSTPQQHDFMVMRLGIGMDRNTAKWFYIIGNLDGSSIASGWATRLDNKIPHFYAHIDSNISPGVASTVFLFENSYWFPAIPVADDLYGYLFIEFYGCIDGEPGFDNFEIGNFTLEFTREKTVLPTTITSTGRARTMADKRQSTIRYSTTNENGNLDKWNADCIFASDNNAEYGYGLLLKADGSYFGKMTYGSVQKYPEQHLCDRVAAYYATAKRKITTTLNANVNALASINPRKKATIDGISTFPISISRNWRDDEIQLTLMEI